MSNFYQLLFFIVGIYVVKASKKLIKIQQTKSISLEIDQLYEQILPQFFQMYQAACLTNLSKIDSASYQQLPIMCKIEELRESTFIANNAFYHYRLADPERYFLGRKKIFNFSNLSKLQGIIDVIEFNGQIIILFQNGYYSFTSIDEAGKITKNEVKLLYDQTQNIHQSNYGDQVFQSAINYGNLLKSKSNQDYLLFIGENKALLLNSTSKIFEDLAGFEQIGLEFQEAILVGNTAYVAVGKKGVFSYEVDFKKKTMQLVKKFKSQIRYNNMNVSLQVSDLAWDSANKQLILNDQEEGLHWIQVQKKDSQENTTPQYSIFMQRCSNLKIVSDQNIAIATCPELLIVNLTSKTHKIIDEIEFNPEIVVVNQSRIMVFGQYRYAVYDLETDLVEKGQSSLKIDFAAIKQNWIVIVNMFSISTGEIHPEQQKLVCYADSSSSPSLLGKSTSNLTIEGICSQLYQMPMLCQTNLTSIFYPSDQELNQILIHRKKNQNCQLIYSINFDVINSSIISYWWEIVAGIIIIWILCSGMIIYCVKDVKVKKEYEQLKEEVNSARGKTEQQTNSQLFSQK